VVAASIIPHVTAQNVAHWSEYLRRLTPDIAAMAGKRIESVIGKHPVIDALVK